MHRTVTPVSVTPTAPRMAHRAPSMGAGGGGAVVVVVGGSVVGGSVVGGTVEVGVGAAVVGGAGVPAGPRVGGSVAAVVVPAGGGAGEATAGGLEGVVRWRIVPGLLVVVAGSAVPVAVLVVVAGSVGAGALVDAGGAVVLLGVDVAGRRSPRGARTAGDVAGVPASVGAASLSGWRNRNGRAPSMVTTTATHAVAAMLGRCHRFPLIAQTLSGMGALGFRVD
jgi:hypothetical protein